MLRGAFLGSGGFTGRRPGTQPGAVGGHKVHRAAQAPRRPRAMGADPKIKNPGPGRIRTGVFVWDSGGNLIPRAATGGITRHTQGTEGEQGVGGGFGDRGVRIDARRSAAGLDLGGVGLAPVGDGLRRVCQCV